MQSVSERLLGVASAGMQVMYRDQLVAFWGILKTTPGLNTVERLYISSGLGTPRDPTGGAGNIAGKRDFSTLSACCDHDLVPGKW